ncbi:MAG: tetratricopeptide repeat protein [Pirellulaceae bacterium]
MTLPGQLPARPSGDRPGIGDRPGRPGPDDRPGSGERPIIGGNRPGWGNGGMGSGNINIGSGNNIINNNTINTWHGGNHYRPVNGGWGYRPDGGHWGNHWYDHHIHDHHHGWYHGAWCDNWGGRWYTPFVYGATAWGLAATLPAWGYNYGNSYAYSNPYYVASETPAYDYSQPIVINTYNTPTADASAEAPPEQMPTATQESMQVTEGYRVFDAGREAFAKGDYSGALRLVEQAIGMIPNDPVLHEFGALCLFAEGDYSRAAAVLNAVLAVSPGMDWTTMSSLYPNVETYTQQLRKLEAFTIDKPNDAAAEFVLAYHYMVVGHTDAAVTELKAVVENQPGDKLAQRMLDALEPPADGPAATATPPATATDPTEAAKSAETNSTAEAGTDLVGVWRAERDGDTFELKVDESATFVWKVTPKSGQPVEISGPLAATRDTLVLESTDQGTMVAKVDSLGTDEFQFVISGGPPEDKGLTFKRAKPAS